VWHAVAVTLRLGAPAGRGHHLALPGHHALPIHPWASALTLHTVPTAALAACGHVGAVLAVLHRIAHGVVIGQFLGGKDAVFIEIEGGEQIAAAFEHLFESDLAIAVGVPVGEEIFAR